MSEQTLSGLDKTVAEHIKLYEEVTKLRRELEALRSPVCEWTQFSGDDNEIWNTLCGRSFWLEDIYTTPAKEGIAYCCYCGKPVKDNPLEGSK